MSERCFDGCSRLTAIVSTVGLALLLSTVSCGSTNEAAGSNSDAKEGQQPSEGSAGGPSGTRAGGLVDGGAPVPPCDPKQTAAIQARFESEAPDDIDAVAFVKDPSCGGRYFTRGPSKYSATTLHLVGSTSKMYVASLILLLAEDGTVQLDAPISKWIDKVPGGDAVHVRHLLNHTSGIYNFTNKNVFMLASAASNKVYTPQQLVDIAFGEPVDFAAGEGWNYSNTNYVLLGMIAEKATGQPVEKLLRARILDPIHAKHTFFYGKEAVQGDIAYGRTATGGNGATTGDPSTSWCAGSYTATPEDLATWLEARASGAFHSAKGNAELFKWVATKDSSRSYGAGLIAFDASGMHGGGKAYGHGGAIWGYATESYYFPDSRTTVVVIVDSDKGPKGSFPIADSYRYPLLYSILDPLFGYVGAADAGK